MGHHSHDGIDWDAKLHRLRESDELLEPETRALAERLLLPGDRSVIEVGSGAGGSAAVFASLLPGGTVTLIDSASELLAAASERVRRQAPGVTVRAVRADAASDDLDDAGQADLVFASLVVHHFPDQLEGLRRLASLTGPGGRLAVVETGLSRRVLPWDVGVGEPGLEARLAAARDEWLREMRGDMAGSVRMPVGWSSALSTAGLTGVRSWSYLVERRAPVSGVALTAVLRRLEWLRDGARDRVSVRDIDAVERLLDPTSPHYAGHRDDVYVLGVDTVHVGTRPAQSA